MISLVRKMFANDKFRYLVAGGCTTMVNIISFFALRTLTTLDRNVCNVIAICLAITFAYFANKLFVFQSKTKGIWQTLAELVSFVGLRIVSLGIEVLGFAILCDSFRMKEIVAKLFVQVVVLVANYIFSSLFVFKKNRRSFKENLIDNYCYYIGAGVVIIFMVAICISKHVMPFGHNSITLVDSLHQYLPFFSEYRDKLLNEGSLFYSWNIALGSNFAALWAYYLSSPFNYLLLLVDQYHIPMMYTIITIMKMALSSVTMTHFLSYKDGRKSRNPGIIAISVAYALSNYVIAYGWNIMWLDCIMILPLVVLGFKRMMEGGKPTMYVLSLFYCVYCNYYIGIMVCLFMVLWFFAYRHRGFKRFFGHGVKFAWYSLLGGGMASFALLPAYLGIMSTASAKMKIPAWKWYGSIFNMFRQAFPLTEPFTNQTFDGNVNLYCGTFAIFAIVLYVFNKKIHWKDKISSVLLLALFMVSFNSVTLNYIWHGMHDQYGIPNRFSFLMIFVMLVMAYDVIRRSEAIDFIDVVLALFASTALLVTCNNKALGGIQNKVMVASAICLIIYFAIYVLRSAKFINRNIFNVLITGFICLEVMINGVFGEKVIGYADYESKYSTNDNVTNAYDMVEEMAEVDGVKGYRAELMHSKVLDEVTWYHMPSVGVFCSTVTGELVTTMGRLGFYTGANEFLYMGNTPFTNSILNVRYLLEREGDYNNTTFEYKGTVDSVGIYENKYALSLGFCVSDKVKEWNRQTGLPMGAQDNLAYYMTGGNTFTMYSNVYPNLLASSDTCDASAEGTSISFVPTAAGDGSVKVAFAVYRRGDYYINCRGTSINKIRVTVNGVEKTVDRYQSQIFHLGNLNIDDSVTIEYIYKDLVVGKQMSASLHVAIFDQLAYEDVINELSKSMLDVTCFEDGYVEGTVTIGKNQTLFTSIPYDKGWKLKVDGKEHDYYALGEAFLCIDLEPGTHIIELTYMPRGMYQGIGISVVCCFLFMVSLWFTNHQNKKTKMKMKANNDIDQKVDLL